jgi:hypothetical protein
MVEASLIKKMKHPSHHRQTVPDVWFERGVQRGARGVQKAELNGNTDAENNHGGSSTD